MIKFLQIKKKSQAVKLALIFALSSVLGLAWFILFYGPYPLNVTYVDWIYKAGGDLFQTQLGWEWLRQTPWHFPLGRIDLYGYPFGTYVTYMNSIPMAALLCKVLSPILPQQFQYIGLWNLFSLIGQMFFGILILREFTPSSLKQVLGASLLTISAPLLFRAFYHDSLTSQWILLTGIWLVIWEYRHKLVRPGLWALLFATALLIHIYLLAMIAPLWLISRYFRFTKEKKAGNIILEAVLLGIITLGVGYCTGLFSLKSGDLSMKGLGYYSWNLDGFFDSQHTSAFLKALPNVTGGQYEGLSYLGLGNLLLLPLAVFLFFKKEKPRRHLFFLLPFAILSILFALFALSNEAYAGTYPLWSFQIPDKLFKVLSLFRASARFIWPVFYFLLLFSLVSILRNTRFSTLLLVAAIGIQLLDLQPLFASKHIAGNQNYQYPLQSEFWQTAAQTNKHVVLYPAEDAWPVYEPIALYTLHNNLTLNWGYFSRANYPEIANFGRHTWEDLKSAHAAADTIYIVWGDQAQTEAKQTLSKTMVLCQIDDYNIVLSPNNPVVNSGLDLHSYCTFPN
jgi:hypothetical protein